MDQDYYFNKHIPLVVEKWTPYGLQGYEVIKYPPGQPFQLQVILRWDSLESVAKAPKDEVHADVKNYTSLKAVTVAGVSERETKL